MYNVYCIVIISNLYALKPCCSYSLIIIFLSHYFFFFFQQCSENKFIGFNYFLQAAECGLHVAMVIVAQAYETGDGLASVDTNTKMKPR